VTRTFEAVVVTDLPPPAADQSWPLNVDAVG